MRFAFGAVVGCGLLLGGVAGAQTGMTENVARQAIAKTTFIQACEGDAQPVFSAVQIAAPVKRKVEVDGKPTLLYPVHARYTQMCVYADQEMRAEVDMRMSFYRDAFGKWTGVAWANTDGFWRGRPELEQCGEGVRCRVQGVNRVTVDKDYRILTRTPVKDTGFIGCTVMFKAAD